MAVTQLTGIQIGNTSVGIVDLSATGTPSSTTYLRGDNTWSTVVATAPDTALTKNIIGVNTVITNGYSAYIPYFMEIVDTFTLEVDLGSYLEIG